LGDMSLSFATLNVICNILECQPGDILEWVPEE
ncbi:MAG: helix-turn-helix transcriptional regulator, partial [Oscillibacter sp.]|nr:helix-turn-helix transcriptional regulator [Oscillibacter sp.]